MSWFYQHGGCEIGPIEGHELYRLVFRGELPDSVMIRRDGSTERRSFKEYYSYRVTPAPPSAAVSEALPTSDAQADSGIPCSICNKSFPDDELLVYESRTICGDCKPEFFQRLREVGIPGVSEIPRFLLRLSILAMHLLWCSLLLILLVFGFVKLTPAVSTTSVIVILISLVVIPAVLMIVVSGRKYHIKWTDYPGYFLIPSLALIGASLFAWLALALILSILMNSGKTHLPVMTMGLISGIGMAPIAVSVCAVILIFFIGFLNLLRFNRFAGNI